MNASASDVNDCAAVSLEARLPLAHDVLVQLGPIGMHAGSEQSACDGDEREGSSV